MSSKNSITIFIGQNEPRVYDLDSFGKDEVRMGRGGFHGNENDGVNDIAVDPAISFISRAHCTFFKTENGWNIRDDKSVNGLVFNNAKISVKQLHDGDKFYIGKNTQERCIIVYSGARNTESAANSAGMGRFPLEGKKKFIIGRNTECDVVIDHPSVSRYHCIITEENGEYYISDNNSMNGVILNGNPLKKKEHLEQMDKITIADTSMVFCDKLIYMMGNAGGVSISANNIIKKVKSDKGEKIITNNVTLSIEPGEFVAIVGGSGAGKTTILNCLAGMTDFTSGDVLINGESIKTNNKSIRSIIGYVPQSDIVYDNLTLERMLYHSAKLRMPKDMSQEEINRKIDETLEMVELTRHRKTMISKLSGGQKKRASIAVELLASPKLFFLDEPSSGLDPGTEKNLMKMLKRLAATGKTVIMVTHTVQNINLCDRLICMGSGGLLCYSGVPSKALEFFRKENITDIYDDLNDNSQEVSARFARMNNVHEYTGTNPVQEKKKYDFSEGFRQYRVLTLRYAEITFNSRLRLVLLVAMPIVLTLLVCISFQADGNLYNVLGLSVNRTVMPFEVAEDTMKLLFSFACAVFWVGIFNSVQEVSKERPIYERERFTGVKPLPYIMSKFTVIGVLCIIQSVIMIAMLVFFSDTVATVDGNVDSATARALEMNEGGIVFSSALWLELLITTFAAMFSAMCLGLTVSSAVSNDMALVICPVCLLPQILFSGVACTLSGATEIMSKVVTCRWACIAFFTSSGVNSMLESCTYDTGTWTTTEFSNGFGVDEAYSSYKTYLFGLDPVISSWIVFLIMAAVCTAAAVMFLYMRDMKFSPFYKKDR